MTQSLWGNQKTKFFSFGPEDVLAAVEAAGFQCTGRCLPLNSYENRVYEVEIELPPGVEAKSPRDTRRVVKFYRPGRWSKAQILDEHQFMADLHKAEVPVITPEPFKDGTTLRKTAESDLFYTVFPKRGGRMLAELNDDQLRWVGRHLARLHQVGQSRSAPSRLNLDPETMGWNNRDILLDGDFIPEVYQPAWESAVDRICELAEPLFEGITMHRIHGDCHAGNLLWDDSGPFFLDFDDMMNGPPVQDFWLLLPGRNEEGQKALELMLEGYEQFREFDRSSLRLIEVLRAFRYIHHSAWLALRWDDPAFPAAFPYFGTDRYWAEQVRDLQEQVALIQEIYNQ